jgi:hypothetical protein
MHATDEELEAHIAAWLDVVLGPETDVSPAE